MTNQEKTTILTNLQNSESKLLKSFEHVSDEVFNSKVTEADWSIANIVEHLIKVEKGVVASMEKNKGNKELIPNKLNEQIQSLLTNPMARKATSPEPFLPSGIFSNKMEAITAFKEHRSWLRNYVETSDRVWENFGFRHFLIGQLNGKDTIGFINGHCLRHIVQINHILNQISK